MQVYFAELERYFPGVAGFGCRSEYSDHYNAPKVVFLWVVRLILVHMLTCSIQISGARQSFETTNQLFQAIQENSIYDIRHLNLSPKLMLEIG